MRRKFGSVTPALGGWRRCCFLGGKEGSMASSKLLAETQLLSTRKLAATTRSKKRDKVEHIECIVLNLMRVLDFQL